MLQDNQIILLQFMARFPCLDYDSCLHILDQNEGRDRVALSYYFRPLTKNGYLSKGKDGLVTMLAKGRALLPDIRPLISVGGHSTRQRAAQVSRMAMLMEENGVPCYGELQEDIMQYFIPSACWRKIAPGILSTTRFVGMLITGENRYAVYDIGDGHMEWQVRAESSLFYCKYGSYETRAHGMIFICNDDARDKVAENIIRQTMWNRRQLLSDRYTERNRPTRWSSAPIRLRKQYRQVFLTTPREFNEDLKWIGNAEQIINNNMAEMGTKLHDPAQGDYENWPKRFFDNPATDLLKYVYFFAAVKDQIRFGKPEYGPPLHYAIICRKKDYPILSIYADMLLETDWVETYGYRTESDTQND